MEIIKQTTSDNHYDKVSNGAYYYHWMSPGIKSIFSVYLVTVPF